MNILQSLLGMKDMTEQVIATDFLIGAKALVRNYAYALSETRNPEVRDVLRKHLESAIDTHEKILRYMMAREYYHVHNPQEQINVDLNTADTVLRLRQ